MDLAYFATRDGEATANSLLEKAESWSNSLTSCGYTEKLKAMYCAYHGAYYDNVADAHQISFGGEEGELAQLPINHLRNLASHMITMTTSNRPVMETRAANSDYKSIIQCKLANSVLEYYMREKRLESYFKTATELAVVMGAGFLKLEWNATAGEIYDYLPDETTGEPDPQRPIYEGDLEFTTHSSFDVVMDGTKEGQNHDWIMVRSFKNKYDLAVKYPDLADKIKGLTTKSEMQRFRVGITNLTEETDDVPVYEFYHRKTDSLPNGRYMLFCDKSIVLQDIGLPFRMIPVFRISAGDILGTPYGYTPLFDVLPIQEGINTLYSTILTNQNATGVQNFWTKPGADFNVSSLAGGLNLIQSQEKPEVLQLLQTSPEVFQFLQMLERTAETLSGVNSVARGNPESSLKTGAALALVQSMALQFISGLQQSYVQLVEDVGSSIIKVLQDYAKAPRMIAIVGKSHRTEMKQFSSDDISDITRVYVDVGNPLAKTIAGRMQIAEQMMQYQVITDPKQIIQVLNTGRLDQLDEDVENELDLIKQENEALMDGEVPPVTVIDEHQEHIKQHRKVLQNPDLRKDMELVQRVTSHIQEHINQLRTADPQLLGLMGQQPLAPPPPPPGAGPQGPPMGPPGNPNAPTGPMAPPQQGQAGIQNAPDRSGHNQIQGPGLPPNGINVPHPSKVKASLLPNPGLQQAALNNVNMKK